MPTTEKNQTILPAGSKTAIMKVKNCESYANTKRENRKGQISKHWKSMVLNFDTRTGKKML